MLNGLIAITFKNTRTCVECGTSDFIMVAERELGVQIQEDRAERKNFSLVKLVKEQVFSM